MVDGSLTGSYLEDLIKNFFPLPPTSLLGGGGDG